MNNNHKKFQAWWNTVMMDLCSHTCQNNAKLAIHFQVAMSHYCIQYVNVSMLPCSSVDYFVYH